MMNSTRTDETFNLQKNLETQLERLVEQLNDLEQCREELEPEEYEETKEDTIEQLKELNRSLVKLSKGDITLISSLESMQMATRAAISQAFKTPEVIKLFGKKDQKQLRDKLSNLEQNVKLNSEQFNRQKAEILTALKQLGEQLSPGELQFLEKYSEIMNALKDIEFVEVENS
ncbi:protein LZIC-like [Onthophagus taurus]|uniref:protein LZIC-like n=1 Tax=Onthophagus taurus TaxID=166361 RepID=UPI0039BDF716